MDLVDGLPPGIQELQKTTGNCREYCFMLRPCGTGACQCLGYYKQGFRVPQISYYMYTFSHYSSLLCILFCRDNQVQQRVLRETSVSCAKGERFNYLHQLIKYFA